MARKLKFIRTLKFQAQQGFCYYCGCLMWEDKPATAHERLGKFSRFMQCTAEHLVAQCEGGGISADNIVAACLWCNRLRHARPNPPTPIDYRNLVRRRVQRGKWHPIRMEMSA